MPTYEYQCSNRRCGNRWELFQSIKAEPERTCPRCRRATAVRLIGIGAGILSGGRGGTDAEQAAPAAKAGATASPREAAPAGAADKAPAATKAGTDAGPAKAEAPAAEPAGGRVNATHPAREGRGAGNLRDAIRRQRTESKGKAPGRAAAKPARGTPRRGRGAGRG